MYTHENYVASKNANLNIYKCSAQYIPYSPQLEVNHNTIQQLVLCLSVYEMFYGAL